MKPLTFDPVAEARRERTLDLLKHIASGLLWIAGVWGGIILVLWGIAR